MRAIVESELGCPLEQVFSSFEDEPIGAASIGQVHRATLRDTGGRVVVKVQYPEVEEYFRYDMQTLNWFIVQSGTLENADTVMREVARSFEEVRYHGAWAGGFGHFSVM